MNRIEVLDHGYVDLVEVWGSDENIVRAARMSTQKGFEGWGAFCKHCGLKDDQGESGPPEYWTEKQKVCSPHEWVKGDEKLLHYLWANRHDTPFEMAGAVLEVQAPIFVFREWHRHRTQSYNEMSARYAPLPDVNYVPTVERLMRGGGHLTKQAGTIADAQQLTPETAELFREALQNGYRAAQFEYEDALKHGVPKELARLIIPVGRYSKMRASANLRNWFGFLTLRNAPNAQWEIQEYARAVESILVERFPRTMEVFRSVER